MILDVNVSLRIFKRNFGLSIIWNSRWRSLTLYKNHKPVLNVATRDPEGFRGVGHLKHCWFSGLFEWELGTRV